MTISLNEVGLASANQQAVLTITYDMLNKILIGVVVFLVLVIVWQIFRYYRDRKNLRGLLAHFMHHEVRYRVAIKQTLDEEKCVNPSLESTDNSSKTDESTAEQVDGDYRLFLRFDYKVMRDKLYLRSDVTRDDLMHLMGVDKNRFGNIMTQYSGAANCTAYLNTKRIGNAISLLQQHPNYTMTAIAADCGFNNTVSFNRVFKEICGMTPTEFKQLNNS